MESKFIPRGYVDRDRWLWINDRCDPGDAARDCPVHFIPHNKFQLPSMVEMISVSEHESLLQTERDRALELERRLAVAKEALEFYADKDNWTANGGNLRRKDNDDLPIENPWGFNGAVARTALTELTKPSIPHKGDK